MPITTPRTSWLLALLVIAPLAAAGANTRPNTPVVTEPATSGQIVNPADVHMETAPFSDPDPADTHVCTDWEIWTVNTPTRVWVTSCIGGIERVHTHLGDGTFVGPYAGRFELRPTTNYELRVRHRDSSGDPATEWSAWATRRFRTSSVLGGTSVPWTFRQSGYRVDVVATGFQLPVNIAFVPNPGASPTAPLFYVTELYGTIKVVLRDFTVGVYATNLLNFNPTGVFPGSGEQGVTGVVVDPITGDVFATMLYDAGGPHYPKIVRFHSTDGGLTAASQTTILDMAGETQGQSHQISNLTIGPDGKLYVHVGDGFFAVMAQDLSSFRGKILRMELDGAAVATNPFYDRSDGITATDYVYAYGFRNPFGGGWRAADGAHYEVENGPSVDRLVKVVPGRNYLWDGTDASMRNYAIHNWSPSVAPVNLAWIQPQTFGGSGFPAAKYDHVFVSESGPTWASGPQAAGKRVSEFVLDARGSWISGPTPLLEYTGTGKATVAALAAGPDGLYFSDLYKDTGYVSPIDPGARILRIRPVTSQPSTAPTTTTLSSVAPVVAGTPSVAAFAVSGPTGVSITGTVTVSDGRTSCTAQAAAGSCTLTFPTSGARSVRAAYSGATGLQPSTSAPLPVTVAPHPTATTIAGVTPSSPLPGTPVSVQFTVAGGLSGVTPGGTVNVSDGATSCTAPVVAGQCTLSFAGAGARSLTATYSGDATFAGSASPVFTLTVTPRTYTLAEGVTGPFWDTYLLLANPNPAPAPVTITFYREDGSTYSFQKTVPSNSRHTEWLDLVPQLGSSPGGVATVVTSDDGVPLVVERATYFDASNGPGGYRAGQLSAAQDGTSTTWYFAEGAQGGFTTYLLLGNFSQSLADVTVTYLLDRGGPVTKTYTVAAGSRVTVSSATEPQLAGRSFGMRVTSSVPIAADRVVYIGPGFQGGLADTGVAAPSTSWLFAEGATGPLFDTFLLLANPGTTPAVATVKYHLTTGAVVARTHTIAPESRTTVWVDQESVELADATFWTEVTSTQPIVAERSMYWPGDGSRPWTEGHLSSGATAGATTWSFAEGVTGGSSGFQTYLLLANPGASSVAATVEYLPTSGPPIVQTYTVAAGARRTIAVHVDVPQLQAASFGMRVTATGPVVAERSIYWTRGTATFVGGTNAKGTPQ